MKDYYRILSVPRLATEDDIQKSFRKLARKYHPDVSKETDAEARMRDINEAHDVLRDAEKRSDYDARMTRFAAGATHRSAEHSRPSAGWEQDFEFHRRATGEPADPTDFSDLFSSVYDADAPPAHAGQAARRGHDHHAAIEVTLEEALNGDRRQVTLRTMEINGAGQRQWRERTLSVDIPPGVCPGRHIRLVRQGLAGVAGAEAGDLVLELRLAPQSLYRVDGHDISMDLPVTPTEAALGAQVHVPMPKGGQVELTVPPNSRAGMKLRVRNGGFPGTLAGHLYLRLQIVSIPVDNEKIRDAYRALGEAAAGFDPRRQLYGG